MDIKPNRRGRLRYPSNETLCEAYLESVPAPISGLLFFAWTKKSKQKKSHPDATLLLRAVVFGAAKRENIKTPPAAVFSLRGLWDDIIIQHKVCLSACYSNSWLRAMRFTAFSTSSNLRDDIIYYLAYSAAAGLIKGVIYSINLVMDANDKQMV